MLVGTSSFAKFDVSRLVSDRFVVVRMENAPLDVSDVERFCGDFLGVLCTSARIDVGAGDEEVVAAGADVSRTIGKLGVVMYVNMDFKAFPYADQIVKWIETDYTQVRVRNLLAGTAVVVRSKIMRTLTNHVLSRAKQGAPRCAFESETEAIKWLKSLANSTD